MTDAAEAFRSLDHLVPSAGSMSLTDQHPMVTLNKYRTLSKKAEAELKARYMAHTHNSKKTMVVNMNDGMSFEPASKEPDILAVNENSWTWLYNCPECGQFMSLDDQGKEYCANDHSTLAASHPSNPNYKTTPQKIAPAYPNRSAVDKARKQALREAKRLAKLESKQDDGQVYAIRTSAIVSLCMMVPLVGFMVWMWPVLFFGFVIPLALLVALLPLIVFNKLIMGEGSTSTGPK